MGRSLRRAVQSGGLGGQARRGSTSARCSWCSESPADVPAFESWIASRLSGENAVLKERRNGREERFVARSAVIAGSSGVAEAARQEKGNKGGGRGGGGA